MTQTTDQYERAVGASEIQPATTLATVLKVSHGSRPTAVAGAIAGVLRRESTVVVQAVGAGAVNQAVKAIAIAGSYLRDEQIDVCFTPSFGDIIIAGEARTMLSLCVERRV
jgi:stage V sporulation protein S